ncbi:hypothetical protein WMY93_023160 [Mugilogobius chulae]|uniref:Uncharacterized protein n=1 Tax=Mugilogobius chulae TaxID=88201 RepID=A0AAW0NFM0_9GOBI
MSDSLDVSLRRSLALGLEVLERASKRRVDWTQIRTAGRSLGTATRETDETKETREQKAAGCFSCMFSPFVCRSRTSVFVKLINAADPDSSSCCFPSAHYTCCQKEWMSEDFHVQLHPGTYSITASDPESPPPRPVAPGNASPRPPQTRLVSLGDGESVLLTFHL